MVQWEHAHELGSGPDAVMIGQRPGILSGCEVRLHHRFGGAGRPGRVEDERRISRSWRCERRDVRASARLLELFERKDSSAARAGFGDAQEA